jgi:hypothetical protein
VSALDASAGIFCRKFLAELALDQRKPNEQLLPSILVNVIAPPHPAACDSSNPLKGRPDE